MKTNEPIELFTNLTLEPSHSGVWLNFKLKSGEVKHVNLCSGLRHDELRQWAWEFTDNVRPGDDRLHKQYEAFKAIRSEREYQDQKWGSKASSGNPGNGNRTIDEFSGYITGYALELLGIAAHSDKAETKLDHIRKIAAMCVACMEQHGAPLRKIPAVKPCENPECLCHKQPA